MDDLLDVIVRVVARIPGKIVGAVAVSIYALTLMVPLALDARPLAIVEWNVLGALVALVLAMAWFITELELRDRRHLVDWTTNLSSLNAQEFEWVVAELFRRKTWKVLEVGRHGEPDGNVDLELNSGDVRMLVQCKRWSALVGVGEIRKFGGTLLREGLQGKDGIFVALSGYTEQAKAEGEKTGMRLVDGRRLQQEMDAARRTEPCPVCGEAMVLDRSVHGWWFRCTITPCKGKRDLGGDPGKAVALLLERP
jgi:HJR/Mrr/RecB family endonuclease